MSDRIRILVVDDDPSSTSEMFKVVSRYARITGISVALVGTFYETTDKLNYMTFDIVVIKACLRWDSSCNIGNMLIDKQIPFVFFGKPEQDNLPQRLRTFPILSEPYDPKETIRTIRRLTRKRTYHSVSRLNHHEIQQSERF